VAAVRTNLVRILGTLYWWICIGLWVGYFYLGLSLGGPDKAVNAVAAAILNLWPPTSDPVFNFLAAAIASIVGLILVPGFLLVGFYLIAIVMVIGIGAWLIGVLFALARISLTGAVVAGTIGVLLTSWIVRRIGPSVRPYLDRIGGTLSRTLIGGNLHSPSLRWKGRGLMANRPSVELPKIARYPLPANDGSASDASQRFQTRRVPTKRSVPAVKTSPAKRDETGGEWDVFISHAGEDQESFVRLLAEALEKRGLRVWYSELKLKLGDSLREEIDRGLRSSRFGIVVLSPNFFRKDWPQKELDGLVALEVGGRKVILPVWHNVTRADVAAYSPMLAGRMAVSTSAGMDKVVQEIMKTIA
jgi:TIR domain